eukprot:g2829.t1
MKETRRGDVSAFELNEGAAGGENALAGIALHHGVVDTEMERELIAWADAKARLGQEGQLPGDTFLQSSFTDPVTGRRGAGRMVLQFGSYYDYGQHEIRPLLHVEPLDSTLTRLIDHLVTVGALPAATRPDTAIINIYRVGDSIPPHIDHPAYPRPFSTLSLLTDAPMLFGSDLRPLRGGVFRGGVAHVLPRRSLLVFGAGRGADVTKHCVPSVASRRISITLRRQPAWARASNARARAAPPLPPRAKLPGGSAAPPRPQRAPAARHTREASEAIRVALQRVAAMGFCDGAQARTLKLVSRSAAACCALALLDLAAGKTRDTAPGATGSAAQSVILVEANPGLEGVCAAEIAFACRRDAAVRLCELSTRLNRGAGYVLALVGSPRAGAATGVAATAAARAAHHLHVQDALLPCIVSARSSRRVCCAVALRARRAFPWRAAPEDAEGAATVEVKVEATAAASRAEAEQLRRCLERAQPVPELARLATLGLGFRATGARVRDQAKREAPPASSAGAGDAKGKGKGARKKRGGAPVAQETAISSVEAARAVGGALAARHGVAVRLRGFALDVRVVIIGRLVLALVGAQEPAQPPPQEPAPGPTPRQAAGDASGAKGGTARAALPPAHKRPRLTRKEQRQLQKKQKQQQQALEPSVAFGMLELCLGRQLLERLRTPTTAAPAAVVLDLTGGGGGCTDVWAGVVARLAPCGLSVATPAPAPASGGTVRARFAVISSQQRQASSANGNGSGQHQSLDDYYENMLLDAYAALSGAPGSRASGGGGGGGGGGDDGAASDTTLAGARGMGRVALLVAQTNVISRVVAKLYLMWRIAAVRPLSTHGVWVRICVLEAVRGDLLGAAPSAAASSAPVHCAALSEARGGIARPCARAEELPSVGVLRLNLLRSRVMRCLVQASDTDARSGSGTGRGASGAGKMSVGAAEEMFSKWVFSAGCEGDGAGSDGLLAVDPVVPHAEARAFGDGAATLLVHQLREQF